METTTYKIPEDNMPRLTKVFAKLSKRAVKLGMEPIVATVVGEELKKISSETGAANKFIKLLLVTISGQRPMLNGWQFVATLEHVDGSNILCMVPGMDPLPKEYRTLAPSCDHCKTKRNRTNTFVVRNVNGDTKQVGRQCIKDFLGHDSPEAVAAYCELMIAAASAAEGEEGFGGGASGKEYYRMEELLAVIASCIRQVGWTSRTVARERISQATVDLALQVMFPSPRADQKEKDYLKSLLPIEQDKVVAVAAIEWAAAIPEDVENDYLWNCRALALSESTSLKTAGIAASIAFAYLREQGKIAERTKAAESQYFGTVGKREVFTLTVAGKYSFDTQYGTTTIHRFIDPAGNVATWFASTTAGLEEGKTYSVKATVKEHGLYKDNKQTVLSRCTNLGEVK